MPEHNPLPKLDHGPSLLPNLDKEIADELTALHKQQFDSIQTAIFTDVCERNSGVRSAQRTHTGNL